MSAHVDAPDILAGNSLAQSRGTAWGQASRHAVLPVHPHHQQPGWVSWQVGLGSTTHGRGTATASPHGAATALERSARVLSFPIPQH